jgi:hypothetical protein
VSAVGERGRIAIGERGRIAVATVAVAALAAVLYGPGAMGYDASWALVWGDQLFHGHQPGYEAAGAPTPHPLLNAVCVLLAPLGDAADEVLLALTALSFGLLVAGGYLLGAHLFSAPVGAVFAAVLLTRATLGGETAQALVDVPYLALVVLAAAMEARSPRRGTPVLAVLSLSGLLRPEGWVLAGAYALYLLPPLGLRDRVRTLALTASAPLAWAASDLAVTGDPLFSLHTTRSIAEQLNRPRDLRGAFDTAPQYLESVLGTGVALAGLAGCVVAVLVLYERALLPLAMLGLGLLTFLGLGVAGLPILNRYLLVPGVLLALFCAVAAAGWTALARGHRLRRALQVVSVCAAAGLAAAIPGDLRRQDRFQAFTDGLHRMQADLERAARSPQVRPLAERSEMKATDHRAVPLIALSLDRPTDSVSTLEWGHRNPPLLFAYTDPLTAGELAIPPRVQPRLAPGRVLHSNRTWTVYLRRPAGAAATRKVRRPGLARLPAESSGVTATR